MYFVSEHEVSSRRLSIIANQYLYVTSKTNFISTSHDNWNRTRKSMIMQLSVYSIVDIKVSALVRAIYDTRLIPSETTMNPYPLA
jgi:hypothetical protein